MTGSKDIIRVETKLLAQLGRELCDMATVGESLQGLMGAVADGGRVDNAFLINAQRLDGLVQHMSELARFLERASAEATADGLTTEALERAAAPIRLSGLSDRLLTSATPLEELTRGECELW
jgi:hypothetical protein